MFRRLACTPGYSSSRRAYSTIPKHASAVVYNSNGAPQDVLKFVNQDLPSVGKKQALVKMLYAPINPADLNMISGTYPTQPKLPAVGGNEGVGRVEVVGEGSNLKVGDLVLPARQGLGTWREAAVLNEDDLTTVPDAYKDVKLEYLATITINPATALRLLTDFVSLKEGDVIIQNGANGMVGLSVVQLAAVLGVKTINIIRPRTDYDDLVERMKQYGAYIVVGDDYLRTAEFRKLISDLPKPKLALNCVGGQNATEIARLLAPGGTMVTYGGMSLQPVTIPTSQLIFNDITLKGFWMSRWYQQNSVEKRLKMLEQLLSLVKAEKLRLWTERHPFSASGFDTALQRASNSSCRDRKVLLEFQ